jgi:hypothetical protein
MIKTQKWMAVIILCATATAAVAQSTSGTSEAVPRLVKYSGVVKDDAGRPKTGVVAVTFALYKDQNGGAPLWLETQNVQTDNKGSYTALLGSTKPDGLPADLFSSNEARWLGVQPEGQAEKVRVLFVSVPYALKAADAETIGGLPPSAFVLASPSGSGSRSTGTAAGTAVSPGASVGGTGTTDFIPKWTKSTTLGNSVLFQSGTGSTAKVGINTTKPGSTLDVNGSGNVSGNLTVKNLTASSEIQAEFGSFTGLNGADIVTVTNLSNGSSGIGLVGNSDASSGIGIEGNAAGSSAVGVEGLGVNGVGVVGQVSGTGTGVEGLGGDIGVVAKGGGVGMEATGTGTGSFGAFLTGGFAGMVAESTNTASGFQNAIFAHSAGATGMAGLFEAISTSKIGGGGEGCCPVGVWGDTGSNAGGAAGLVGTADDARAIYLENNSPSGVPTAFMRQDSAGQFALQAGGTGGFCTIDTNGHENCPGGYTENASVDSGKRQVALYSMQSPQNWFEDFGSGRLSGGLGRVTLDTTFAQTVNLEADYHVFLTPVGECRGLYVANKSATGFEVHEIGGGLSNVAFDYRIVALRRGFENLRLADVTESLKKLSPGGLPKVSEPRPSMRPPVHDVIVKPKNANLSIISAKR